MATARQRNNDHFFSYLRDWSHIKLRILEKYLCAYLNKRGRFHPTIYYIDGYAGPGYYGDGSSDPDEGSPLRIARMAQQRRDFGKPGRFVCIYTESDPDYCDNLRDALSRAAIDSDSVHVFCGTFQQHLTEILKLLRPGPAVCFLDPFGVNGISPAELKPLLQRPNTEFLLNLNTGILRRMAGFEDSSAKDRNAKLANVSRTLGEDPTDSSPNWLNLWQQFNDSRRWEMWAAQTYMKQLVSFSPDLRYAMAYEVRAKFRARPKYYLVFASRSSHAFPIMNDFLCTEEDDLFAKTEAVTPTGQTSFLQPLREQERDSGLVRLAEEIHAYGHQHQGVNREALIEHFTYVRLGQFRKAHWRQALKLLVDQGRVRRGAGTIDEAPLQFV
jgi:three-Cys-motif partner protein